MNTKLKDRQRKKTGIYQVQNGRKWQRKEEEEQTMRAMKVKRKNAWSPNPIRNLPIEFPMVGFLIPTLKLPSICSSFLNRSPNPRSPSSSPANISSRSFPTDTGHLNLTVPNRRQGEIVWEERVSNAQTLRRGLLVTNLERGMEAVTEEEAAAAVEVGRVFRQCSERNIIWSEVREKLRIGVLGGELMVKRVN